MFTLMKMILREPQPEMKINYHIDRASLRKIDTFKNCKKVTDKGKISKEIMNAVAKIISLTA